MPPVRKATGAGQTRRITSPNLLPCMSFGYDSGCAEEIGSEIRVLGTLLHAETPVQTKTKHVFLQRVACASANPDPFALCAEVLGNAIFHAGAC